MGRDRAARPFCALNGLAEINTSSLKRMAGTTRLELATSAVTADTSAIVGNRRAYWAWSEGFCATVCATPAVKCSPHLCRGDRRCPLLLNPAKSKLQKLREHLRLVPDEELVKFGKMVRWLTEPRVSVMPDTWKEQLQEARAEWRRRQPKAH